LRNLRNQKGGGGEDTVNFFIRNEVNAKASFLQEQMRRGRRRQTDGEIRLPKSCASYMKKGRIALRPFQGEAMRFIASLGPSKGALIALATWLGGRKSPRSPFDRNVNDGHTLATLRLSDNLFLRVG